MRDFNQLDFKSIEETQHLIAELESQVVAWADPSKFDNLYQAFQKNLVKLDQCLRYSNEYSSLEKFILIQNTKQFIDVIDRTIKSLAYSRLYESAESDNLLRSQRYRKLIIDFENSMKPWLKAAYPHKPNRIAAFTEQFEKVMQNTANDKNPISNSPGFNVTNTIINNTDIYDANFSVNLRQCKTLEDWFTCVHQNFVAAIDEVEKQQNLIMGREFYPPLVSQFEEAFMALNSKDLHGARIGNPQNHLDANPPHIIYKIPISIHSAMVTIFQSPTTGAFLLQYITGSSASDTRYRWGLIKAKAQFDLVSADINLEPWQAFSHEEALGYQPSNTTRFCVSLSENNIPTILKTIEQAITWSFGGDIEHTPEAEQRFLLLETLNEEALKKARAVALNLIKNGYFKKCCFFDNNITNRMKVLHKLIQLEKPKDQEDDDWNEVAALTNPWKTRSAKSSTFFSRATFKKQPI